VGLQDLIGFVNGMIPGLGEAVQRVWNFEEEVDVEQLAEAIKMKHTPDTDGAIDACIGQLCTCTQVLLEEHGLPDPSKPIPRKRLVRSVDHVAVVQGYIESTLDGGEDEDDESTTVSARALVRPG
jgi:hypothetical protein